MFVTLHAELAKRGSTFRLVEARSTVRDMLRTEGVEGAEHPRAAGMIPRQRAPSLAVAALIANEPGPRPLRL